MKLSKLNGSVLLATSLILLGCGVTANEQPKPLPEFPLTLEGLEAFANKADFELIQQYSSFDNEFRERKLLRESELLLDVKFVPYYVGLAVSNRFGGEMIDKNTPSETKQRMLGSSSQGWDKQGRLVHVSLFDSITEADLSLLTKHKHLRSIDLLVGPLTQGIDIDIKHFMAMPGLESLAAIRSRTFNLGLICQHPNLRSYNGFATFPQGPIRFTECTQALEELALPTARLDDIEVANLPNLRNLYLSSANITKLSIDGNSLPKLEYIDFTQTRLPEDLSQVNLPKNLKQIDLSNSGGDRLNRLVLPENLKYINLRHSNFSDYSFLTTAKNLESLDLANSSFTQFEILTQFPKLKHLDLNSSALENEHIKSLLSHS